MKKLIIFFILLINLLVGETYGQNAPVSYLPDITCNPGDYIDVPIYVTNFNNIGALSLKILYTDSTLIYQSFTNNSGFPSLMVNGAVAGEVTSSGLNFGGPGITLPDSAILFTITFFCSGGFAELQWFDDGSTCEFTDNAFNPLNDYPTCLYYKNGTVNDNSFELQLKVFLEGPFANGGMSTTLKDIGMLPTLQPYTGSPFYYNGMESVLSVPDSVVDWVLVELRESAGDASTATSDKAVARQAGFLLNDGSIKHIDDCSYGNLRFSVNLNKNLYLVIYHRNHLSIISANPISIINGVGSYDFTSGQAKVWGGSLGYKELSSGVWGMVSGDINGDGLINELDKQNEWDQSAGTLGYLPFDFSFDSQVDNKDKNDFWDFNNGFESQVPN